MNEAVPFLKKSQLKRKEMCSSMKETTENRKHEKKKLTSFNN